MKPESLDAVFHALAHKTRRRILDIVKDRPGCTVGEICREFDVSRIAVIKHITVLTDANLLITEKVGRRKTVYLNAVPIQMIYDRWTTEFSSFWTERLTEIKYRAERTAAEG